MWDLLRVADVTNGKRQSSKLLIQKRVSKKIVYIKVTYKYKTRKYIESRELKAKHNLSKICVTKEGGL